MTGYGYLRSALQVNWYLDDFVKRMAGRTYNKKMMSVVQKMEKIESIFAVEELLEELEMLPKALYHTSYTFKRVFSENTLYGYAAQIMKYAGIPSEELFYFPLLEHGISYGQRFDPLRYNLKHSYVFQGTYRKRDWDHLNNHKRAYYIGPYIHYAEPMGSEESILELRRQLGRTVLLFLPHSTEYENMNFDIDEILKNYLRKTNDCFDTILICVFWKDINEKLLKSIDQKNFKLVTAGFKLDPCFVRRLKTILEITDKVIYTSFSSSIGYSYYLGKEIIADIKQDDLTGQTPSACLNREMNQYFNINSKATNKMKNQYIDKYWGISKIRTPDYIRKIYKYNKTDLVRHIGF